MHFSTGLIILLTVLGIVFYYLQKQQDEDDAEQKNSSPSLSLDQQSVHKEEHGEREISSSASVWDKQCRHFSLAEIKLATHDFDDAFVIGKGGFGKVYRGTIVFGTSIDVAIKRLNIDSNQGATEFWAEIEMLSKVRHSHIVSLLGYHEESGKQERILVYEYMPNGSLEDHLHRRRANGDKWSPLTWVQRLRICIGAARGLDYLHTGTGVKCRVIHRDVKSSNILVDENWAVLCGRPAVDFTLDEKQHNLAGWAKRCVEEGTVDQIVDPYLTGQVSASCLKEFVQISYKCLLRSPKDRPTMTEVVARLELVLALALALQKHSRVTIVEKMRLLFSMKLPVLHTKNYRNRQKRSNDNKSKGSILDKAASTMAEGTSEGKNNGVILVDPTKEAEGSSDNMNKGVTTENSTMTIIEGSSDYINKGVVPTAVKCDHATTMLKAQSSSRQIGTQNLKIFTFDELRRATRNMRPSAMLGASEGESVYKGWVDGASYEPSIFGVGIAVAVKISNTDKVQSLKEWQAEVNRGKFSHPNLVKLLGYCSEDKMLILVHEYTPKRNLLDLLNGHPLQWGTTMKIACGAAHGLAFLHTVEDTPVYRTFDASNVLLNKDFEVELYFGSATLGRVPGALPVLPSDSLISRYTAPEYMATGDWYAKSDVYALGVMMLAMISGSCFLGDSRCSSPQSFMEWARPILLDTTKLQKFMDPWLDQGKPPKGASKAGQLIINCLEIVPEHRPSMRQVMARLEVINSMER